MRKCIGYTIVRSGGGYEDETQEEYDERIALEEFKADMKFDEWKLEQLEAKEKNR